MASLAGDAEIVIPEPTPFLPMERSERELWESVDELIDSAPSIDALAAHRLHLLAARRWAEQGRALPQSLIEERRGTAFLGLIGELVLQRAREACDGPLILLKGPEVANYYPDPSVRPYRDLDLLVPDASAVQDALLAAGFQLTGDERLYRDIHHRRPLVRPELPLLIEVHDRPKWVAGLPCPEIANLLAAAVPSTTGVEGILALPPAEHALVLTAHAWAHEPLRRLLDVIDIAAVALHADEGELRSVARAWKLEKLWLTTDAVIEALFYGGPRPVTLRTWAKHLRLARERTVLESHLERTFSSFWALPVRPAMAETRRAVANHFRPEPGERRRVKLARSTRAFLNAFTSVAEHDRAVEADGLQAPSKEVKPDELAPTNERPELARDRR
jgi:hypothetical protein